jgi:hypothetical protein
MERIQLQICKPNLFCSTGTFGQNPSSEIAIQLKKNLPRLRKPEVKQFPKKSP